MKHLRTVAAVLILAATAVSSPRAQERILAYDSDVTLNADGSLEVSERIRVRAEGHAIRRGIYRDFPTRYRDRHGNRVVVDFDVIEVLRDGHPEPWFTETLGNGVRVNTGNDGFLPVPAEYTYTLRYRTTRQTGFFADHDELYWNAIGTGWAFAVEGGRVELRLPSAVPVADMSAGCYTGPQGARGRDCRAETVAPGVARWTLTRPLAPHEGMTVVLSFPKGVVAEPTRAQRLWWLLKDNRAGLVALAGLAALLAFCLRRWRRVGRDPAPGTVVVQYDPPEGLSPSALRYIERMRHDALCFSADVLSLAVAGHLRIHREKGLLKDEWRLERTSGGGGTAPEQEVLLQGLFRHGPSLELDRKNAPTLQSAMAAHARSLKERFHGSLFNTNAGSTAVAFLIAGGSSMLAIAFGAGTGSGLLLAVPVIVAMFGVATAFAFLFPAHTPEGRRMLDRIEGLRRYLGVAERQDLQRLQGPDAGPEPRLDAARYEFLLPYAVALQVEDAWTRKFTLAVGEAAAATATASVGWYHGTGRGAITDLGSLGKTVGQGLATRIASSATPPGSSSGAGGGGFSGGGGGGGGGGGR